MASSRRFRSKHKLFKDLTDKDFIYQINPFNEEIEGLKIKEMNGVKLSDGSTDVSLKRKVAITIIRRDAIIQSTDLDKIRTLDFIVNMDDSATFVMMKIQGMGEQLIPVPIFSNYALAQEFKNQ